MLKEIKHYFMQPTIIKLIDVPYDTIAGYVYMEDGGDASAVIEAWDTFLIEEDSSEVIEFVEYFNDTNPTTKIHKLRMIEAKGGVIN